MAVDTTRGAAAQTTDVANPGSAQTAIDANGVAARASAVGSSADALADDRSMLARDADVTSGAPRSPGVTSSLERAAEAAKGTPLHAIVAAQGNGAAASAVLLDPARHRPVVVPLAPERYKVQMTIGAETLSKLRRAQDLLRHQVPDGDLSVVFDRALTLLVTELERKKCAIVNRPRDRGKAAAPSKTEKTAKASAVVRPCGSSSNADVAGGQVESATGGRPAGEHKSANCSHADKPNGSATTRRNKPLPDNRTDAKPAAHAGGSSRRSRHIPAKVKRDVWERDRGRCAFVGPEGPCEQTGRLEYHHVVPFAVGGEATADSIQLRCRSHNQHEAAQYFGFDCSRFSKKIDDAVGPEGTGSGTSNRLKDSTGSGIHRPDFPQPKTHDSRTPDMVRGIKGKQLKQRTWVRTKNCPLFRVDATGDGYFDPRNSGGNR
jgi:hypothetical protein